MLLAAGALAGLGRMNLAFAWSLAIFSRRLPAIPYGSASAAGAALLHLSTSSAASRFEPDTLRAENWQTTYCKHGVNWLLFAKLSCRVSAPSRPLWPACSKVKPVEVSSPMDTAGAILLWLSGAYLIALGWGIFRDQLELVAALWLERLGSSLIAVLAGGLVLYIAFKYFQRQRVYRDLRIARITPQELKRRMDKGEDVVVIDLRSEFEWADGRIPGALTPVGDNVEELVSPASIQTHIAESEVVLYCSCPNEISSARAALRLKRHGVQHVRPLEGGFPVWK